MGGGIMGGGQRGHREGPGPANREGEKKTEKNCSGTCRRNPCVEPAGGAPASIRDPRVFRWVGIPFGFSGQ